MSARIVITPRADQDIDGQIEYIGQNSLSAACRFRDALEATFQRLGEMPELGGLCEFENPRAADVRVWSLRGFENHLVFYRPIDGGVEIVRVLHGSRDWQALFEAS